MSGQGCVSELLHNYTEESARATVQRRNKKSGGLNFEAPWCGGDHWHVFDKREFDDD